jgi:hypothetical protein
VSVPIDLGAAVRLQAECRDLAGTLTNASTVTLAITLPDGTVVTPPVTNPPADTGMYRCDYTTVQAGRHAVYWTFTGPPAAYTDTFDVRPAEPPLLLSLAAAKAHLNLTTSAHDEEVRFWIGATTRCVEHYTGPVVRRTVTETHDHLPYYGARAVPLRITPVLALVSAAALDPSGTTYDVDDLYVDENGILRRTDGGRLAGPLRVTYTVGRTVVGENITAAARIILQHLWRTQGGPGRPALGTEDFAVTEPIPGLGYAIPNRALQLLEADRLGPGVA